MKALSLTQPWATLVVLREKAWETRSWPTNYRGQLAIHAAKGFPKWAKELCGTEPFKSALAEHGYNSWSDLPLGGILGDCRLMRALSTNGGFLQAMLGAQEIAFGDYSKNRYGFLLENVQEYPVPIPTRGALGLWEWREEPCNLCPCPPSEHNLGAERTCQHCCDWFAHNYEPVEELSGG